MATDRSPGVGTVAMGTTIGVFFGIWAFVISVFCLSLLGAASWVRSELQRDRTPHQREASERSASDAKSRELLQKMDPPKPEPTNGVH